MDINEQKILNMIESETEKYIKSIDVDTRKKESQFFTSYKVAAKMVGLIDMNRYKSYDEIKILEPSSGFGMLIFALILELKRRTEIRKIILILYENDSNICISLSVIIKLIKQYLNAYDCNLEYKIVNEDFILSNKYAWNNGSTQEIHKFNLIISNPPYKKIKRNDSQASTMNNIVTDQPNLYHLFIALSLKLLKENGEYITLTPRNYLVGKYTRELRRWILDNFSIANLHSFDSRTLFREVNQEVIITRFVNYKQNKIKISHNSSSEFTTSINKLILDKDKYMILLPTIKESLSIVNNLQKRGKKLFQIGIKCIVGPIVQFRNLEYLSKDKTDKNNIPFLIPTDLKDNFILFNERSEKYKYISDKIKSRLTGNTNGVLLRKITAKDDKKFIVGAILNKEHFSTEVLGLDSNLIFFQGNNREMSLEECYGLYAFLVSSYFSEYYLLINGTHTINIFELSSMYFPKTEDLVNIGKEFIRQKQLGKEDINELIDKYITT